MERVTVKITVNGAEHEREVEPRLLLVDFLREELDLKGTHIGCDTSHCGACTVLLDGFNVKSCTVLAVQADGREVTTIEGVAPEEGKLHPLQDAFWKHHALQCGYCSPGMVMSALAFLSHRPSTDEEEIRRAISGNLCRCTGYQFIVDAVREVVERQVSSE